MSKRTIPESLRWRSPLAAALLAVLAAPAFPQQESERPAPQVEGRRLVVEKAGSLSTRDGQRLRLATDVGAVRISSGESGQVSYRVRVETDATQPDAEQLVQQFLLVSRGEPTGVYLRGHVPWRGFRGRLWVSFEVRVPRHYHLEVATQAGDITVEDLDGDVVLESGGGDLVTGRVRGRARLETRGGHIRTGDVDGSLAAVTAGGHVVAGAVGGDALLRSGGGHVKVVSVGGRAELESAGGNISIQQTAGGVRAATGGGRIEVGEAHGAIEARTGGGGVRIARVAGPTQLESSGGSIYLTRVQGPVQATTTAGSITAWLVPEGKLESGSQLICAQGDIVVYLPRLLPLTIEAVIEGAAPGNRIDFDPELPVILEPAAAPAGMAQVRGRAQLNGGGQVLRLQTVGGSIQLRFADSSRLDQNRSLYQLQLRQLERGREETVRRIEHDPAQLAGVLRQRAAAAAREEAAAVVLRSGGVLGQLQAWVRNAWHGRVRVDYAEQKKRLIEHPLPEYPAWLKRAGVQGAVQLELTIGRDGHVLEVRKISGHDALADAAAQALRRWRFAPTVVEGRAVEVVTVVPLVFRLN